MHRVGQDIDLSNTLALLPAANAIDKDNDSIYDKWTLFLFGTLVSKINSMLAN